MRLGVSSGGGSRRRPRAAPLAWGLQETLGFTQHLPGVGSLGSGSHGVLCAEDEGQPWPWASFPSGHGN